MDSVTSKPRGRVRVTNMRVSMSPETCPEEDESVVVIDRTNLVLGNKHVLYKKSDLRAREQVIAAYKKDLDADMSRDGPMSRELNELAARVRDGEKLCLSCWCQPSPCHGDLLVKVINQINTEIASHRVNEVPQTETDPPLRESFVWPTRPH